MERFYLEIPTIKRKEEAIDYISEFNKYNSKISGTGFLNRYVDNYELWLQKLEEDYVCIADEEYVPSRTYFLIRENDNKIIGMINIRLVLNKNLKKSGGHIGYGIRPTERKKGYGKINLYLGLKKCDEYGIDNVLLTADINNTASWKTMESLGGKRIKEFYNEEYDGTFYNYNIDVKESLEKHKDIYGQFISNTEEQRRVFK